MCTEQAMSSIRDIILSAAAISGAAVAWLGLSTWKRQLRGGTEYDHARKLLRAVYKIREAISWVRSPFMTGGEMAQALRDRGLTDEEIAKRMPSAIATEAAYEARWHSVTEALTDMNLQALEAEVLFGSKVRDALKPLRACIGKLKANVWSYVWALHYPDDDTPSSERRKERSAVLYELFDKPEEDPFLGEIHSAVQKIETIMRPYLK
jgi:hypothetical protein